MLYIILQKYLLLFNEKKNENPIQDTDSLQSFPVGVSESVR